MTEMVYIIREILSPIFFIILAGYIIQRKFKLDLSSLAKVQLYLFIPSLLLIKISTSELKGSLVASIVSFTIVLFIVLMIISFITSRILGLDRKKEKSFMNSVILRNQANFGIPLITLAFLNDDFALSIHMMVMFTTTLLLYTIGLYNTSSGTYSKKSALISVLRLPIIYVVIAGFIIKNFQLTLPNSINVSLDILSKGVVPLALFTLGAQLSNADIQLKKKVLPLVAVYRLILSPILAYFLTLAFGFSGTIQDVLIIGAAAPTAINSVLLAIEFNGDADFASESVFLTTLLSTVTVSLVILAVR